MCRPGWAGRWILPAVIAWAALIPPAAAEAGFMLVENFDLMVPGPIDGQGGWLAGSPSSIVTPDPADPDNQVLAVRTESTYLYRDLLLAEGTTRMLFLRFRFSSQLNGSWGLSDHAIPYRFDHFEVELGLDNASPSLRINDGGTYDVLAVLQPDFWYNCWILVDNLNDQTRVWLHPRGGDDAAAADQLDADGQMEFLFRNTTAGDLLTFFIKTGGGSGVTGPLYLDDIYLETTDVVNLDNPTATPAGVDEAAGGLAPAVRVAPQPVHRGAIIDYSLGAAGRAELTVFDLAGRPVRVLASGTMAAGAHRAWWDACDQAGRPVAAGVYWLRLAAGGESARKSVVVVR